MKILIIGKGVIGCIYGNVFLAEGHDITHYVRASKLAQSSDALDVDILDKRNNALIKSKYKPKYTTEITDNRYDLIFVSVRHTNIEEVVGMLAQTIQNTPILVFGNVWGELNQLISKVKNSEMLFFGMPRAGGFIKDNLLYGAVMPEIILENSQKQAFSNIHDLFVRCKIKPKLIANMQSWYWTHFATTSAWICGGVEAKGFIPFSKSTRKISNALKIGRETLEIVKQRGADITVCDDAKPFLAPIWISALITRMVLTKPETIRISGGHGDYAPDELFQIYSDIRNTAQTLHIKTPLLDSCEPYFKLMNENKSPQ